MQFDDLINSLLSEDEVSKKDKLAALKNLSASKSYRIIEHNGDWRAFEISNVYDRDEIVDSEKSIEAIAEEEYLKVKQNTRDLFTDDEDANSYIEAWFRDPVYNDDRSIAQCKTSEGIITILSEASKYFNYSEEDIYDNWGKICSEVKWPPNRIG